MPSSLSQLYSPWAYFSMCKFVYGRHCPCTQRLSYLAISASQLRAACCITHSRHHSVVASQPRGLAASRPRGLAASQPRSLAASQPCGLSTLRPHGIPRVLRPHSLAALRPPLCIGSLADSLTSIKHRSGAKVMTISFIGSATSRESRRGQTWEFSSIASVKRH